MALSISINYFFAFFLNGFLLSNLPWLLDITKKLIYSFGVILYNMITKEQILIFKKSADTLYAAKDYTSASILYFKTWFAVQDFILIEKTGRSPKDHTERFRMLEKEFPGSYNQLDKEFSTYRDTYSKIVDKSDCDRIKEIVENEIKTNSIKE